MGAGACVSGSWPPPDFGKAMTLRIASKPPSSMTSRSGRMRCRREAGAAGSRTRISGRRYQICAYFPYPIKIWLNGHEWTKRQASKAGIGWTALLTGSPP
jgi:hypothetical protein